MSKIGNNPIEVPISVTVKSENDRIEVKGPNGELFILIPKNLHVSQKENVLIVGAGNNQKKTKSLHGLYRQLIFNAVWGVAKPWEKRLEIVGTGYNVKLQGEDLVFKMGYSHPIVFKKTPKINYKVEGNTKVVVSGVDKQLVGQVAYQIKQLKKPDAYKGKGIRYEGEQIKLKPGKKVKTAGAI